MLEVGVVGCFVGIRGTKNNLSAFNQKARVQTT